MAATKKAKKLTSIVVNKEAKLLDEQITVSVYGNDQEEYELKIDKVFRKSKALTLNMELLSAAQYAEANNVDFELMLPQYALILVLKHYTSFGDGMIDNIAGQIELLSKLDDLGLLEPIIESMPEGQLDFVFELIQKSVEALHGSLEESQAKLADLEREVAEVAALADLEESQ